VAQPSRDSLRVTVRFDNRDGAHVAELDFTGAKPGERSFSDRSANCASLQEAVAVAIVLLLDSETELREKPPAYVAPLKSSVLLMGGRVELTERAPIARTWLLSAAAGPLWGFSRSLSAWYGVAFAAEFPGQMRLGLGATAMGPARIGFENGTVDVSLIAIELKGCKSWGKSWRFGVCGAPAIGRLHGRGNGFDEGLVANMVWYAWETEVLLQVPIGNRWFAGGEVLTWIPLSKQTLSVENAGTAWNPSSVWGGLGLRLGVRFD
jgi:hypothetical protein